MKRLVALVLAIWPGAVWSQAVSVQSGDHDGFSRLVLEMGAAVDWKFHRTADGYALQVQGQGSFDVSKVFDLIKRDRLTAVWADPESGDLLMRLNCVCHALPYELAPGTIVIDFRDGPAPEGSSFELMADGQAAAPLMAAVPFGPMPANGTMVGPDAGRAVTAGYDWTSLVFDESAPPVTAAASDIPSPEQAAQTNDLREDLYRQLGAGASAGVIDLEVPKPKDPAVETAMEGTEHLRIGQELGMITLPGGKDGAREKISLSGQTCPTEEDLDVSAWGNDAPVSVALPQMRGAIMGELDKAQDAALLQAVRYHLYLGFGAEARQMLRAFAHDGPGDDLAMGMSWAVDGQADPAAYFHDFASCNTPAALWAALSSASIADLTDLNHGAVMRAFANLPPTLRQALGPALARQYLDMGMVENARQISDAITRVVAHSDAATSLVEAQVDLALGDESRAETAIETVASENSAVAPQALLDIVTLRLTQGKPVEAEHISALAALAQEYRDDRMGQDLRRAEAVALSTAGRFDEAFAVQADLQEELPEVWHLLALKGSDADILQHAVRESEATDALNAQLNWPDRRHLAERLATLGLPDPALLWLEPGRLSDPDPNATALLRARLEGSRFDAPAVLQELSGTQNSEAAALRAEALLALEQPDAAAQQFASFGDSAGLARAGRAAGNWSSLPPGPADIWQDAAGLAPGFAPPADVGPLEQSRQLITESEAARALLDKLLIANTVAD